MMIEIRLIIPQVFFSMFDEKTNQRLFFDTDISVQPKICVYIDISMAIIVDA